MKARLQAYLDSRPNTKEALVRAIFRTRLFVAPTPAAKARLVGYDHRMFRDALRDNANKNGRELHSLMHLRHVLHALQVVGRNPGGEVLEIGAGRAGLPVLLLLCGFDRVHVNELSNAVNRFDRAHVESLHVLASLMGVCRRPLHDVVVPLDDLHYAIRGDRMRAHAYTDAQNLAIPSGSLSAVVSFTVLEHLRNPTGVMRHLRSCLEPGGWMCHVVDFRDHEDFTRPLDFLTVAPDQYHNRLGDWCNRLRFSDFVRTFTDTGFELCSSRVTSFNELDDRKSTEFWKMLNDGPDMTFRPELDPADHWVTEEQRVGFHADYQSYSRAELSILQAEFITRAR